MDVERTTLPVLLQLLSQFGSGQKVVAQAGVAYTFRASEGAAAAAAASTDLRFAFGGLQLNFLSDYRPVFDLLLTKVRRACGHP